MRLPRIQWESITATHDDTGRFASVTTPGGTKYYELRLNPSFN